MLERYDKFQQRKFSIYHSLSSSIGPTADNDLDLEHKKREEGKIMYFAHVWVIHFENWIQPLAALFLLVFVLWIAGGLYFGRVFEKGRSKGYEEGYDFAVKKVKR